MYRKKQCVGVRYYLWFQASTGDVETRPLQVREDYCNQNLLKTSVVFKSPMA